MSQEHPYSRTAVLVPCFNESATIAKVVQDFRTSLPEATVYVFDNASTDGSADLARQAGAVVVTEKRRGKGHVVAAMLNQVDADYYLMVDGDDTYPADRAADLLQPIIDDQADMVVGQRLSSHTTGAFPRFHRFGNRLVCSTINLIFSSDLVDVMSGYRAFNRDVAESLPILACGFDVETEMTLQCRYQRLIIREIPVLYRERPAGSTSKLRTVSDGIRVLFKILGIFKAYKPMTFFGGIGILAWVAGILTGLVVVHRYPNTDTVLSMALVMFSLICFLVGLLMASVGVTIHTLNFRIMELGHTLSKRIAKSAPGRRS